jgi:hypothetical protein|tara:strand:+ start:412 stop:648 length:237 start_codon:yes stop_codon:yes gene_type:complete
MLTNDDMKRIEEDRGPGDLTLQIDMLTKQKEYMQKKCREAGAAILDLEFKVQTLTKDIDRLSEENDNLKIMMKGKNEQ